MIIILLIKLKPNFFLVSYYNKMAKIGGKTVVDSTEVDLELASPSKLKFSVEVEELKDFLKENFPNGIDYDSIVDIVVRAMQHLSRKRKMTGRQKKQTVSQALILLIDETDTGSLQYFDAIVKAVVPNIVDNFIDVEKGKIKLNKRSSCLTRYLCCCFRPCCG